MNSYEFTFNGYAQNNVHSLIVQRNPSFRNEASRGKEQLSHIIKSLFNCIVNLGCN